MGPDCFPDEPFHFLLRVADDADPWEVRAVGPQLSPSCSITTRYSLIAKQEEPGGVKAVPFGRVGGAAGRPAQPPGSSLASTSQEKWPARQQVRGPQREGKAQGVFYHIVATICSAQHIALRWNPGALVPL